MEKYELMPIVGQQKSFYGKAHVIVLDDGTKYLESYGILIMKIEPSGKMTRCTDIFTSTTGKHIRAFSGLKRKEFKALSFEEVILNIESKP